MLFYFVQKLEASELSPQQLAMLDEEKRWSLIRLEQQKFQEEIHDYVRGMMVSNIHLLLWGRNFPLNY